MARHGERIHKKKMVDGKEDTKPETIKTAEQYTRQFMAKLIRKQSKNLLKSKKE